MNNKIFLVISTVLFGLAMAAAGLYLAFWHDSQMKAYNQGLSYYRTLKFEESVGAFEQSDAAYKFSLERNWIERFVFPNPNREVAALAQMHKANALIRTKQIGRAIKAYKRSLVLNPGSGYLEIPGYMEKDLDASDLARLAEQARLAKHNLELLLKNIPEPEQKKGNGNKIESNDEESPEQIPQLSPGSQPGKGGKDDI